MRKRNYKYFLLAFASMLFFASCDKKLDWRANYDKTNAQPYGSKSLYELMPDVLGEKFEDLSSEDPLFKRLPDYLWDSISNLEYHDLDLLEDEEIKPFNLFIVRNDVELSPADVNTLELAARKGAHIFLSGYAFSDYISEFYLLDLERINQIDVPDTALYNFPRMELLSGKKTFLVRSAAVEARFVSCNVDDEILLETKNKEILAFRRKIGTGSISFCSTPKLFTNIHFLYQSPKLVQSFYQDFPKQETLWGNDYRSYDFSFRASDKGLLSFILKYQSLRWAWYLVLTGAILYILSNMKRKQNALLPKKINENLSLKYVTTVAMLYRKSKNHSEIFRKKVELFSSALYEKFDLRKSLSASEKANNLYQKTGKKESVEDLELSFNSIEKFYNKPKLSTKEYIQAFKTIESLKKKYL